MKQEDLIESFRAYCSENEMDFSLDDIQLIFTPDRRSLGNNFFSPGVIGQTLRQNCLKCQWMIKRKDCAYACENLMTMLCHAFWVLAWCVLVYILLATIEILPLAIVALMGTICPGLIVGNRCLEECGLIKRKFFRILCIPLSLQTQQLYGKDYFLLERRGLFTMSEEMHRKPHYGIVCLVEELNVNFFSKRELTKIRFRVDPTEIPGFAKLSRYTLDENGKEQVSAAVLPDTIAERIAQFAAGISDVV